MLEDYTIDRFVNRFIPQSILPKLPTPISRFLGYRRKPEKQVSQWIVILDVFIITFASCAILQGIFNASPVFIRHHAPPMLASYAATCILTYTLIDSPLAQPRNVFFGHFIGALIGVSLVKLFGLSSGGRNNMWAAGSLAVSLTTIITLLLGCSHPPAGASAVLPAVDSQVRSMSWWFLADQVISSVVVIALALATNNIFRVYPKYWWTPKDVRTSKLRQQDDKKLATRRRSTVLEKVGTLEQLQRDQQGYLSPQDMQQLERARTHAWLGPQDTNQMAGFMFRETTSTITIDAKFIKIPKGIHIGYETARILETLQSELRNLDLEDIQEEEEEEHQQQGSSGRR